MADGVKRVAASADLSLRTIAVGLLAWLGAILTATPVLAATVPGAESSSARAVELQAALDEWAAAPGHGGTSAAVIFPDGNQWAGAAGLAGDNEFMRVDHLVQVASITKTMTGAVILQLVEEERLRLDDPVSRWLPPIKHVDPAITIRQLLNHTNGLANYSRSEKLQADTANEPCHVFTAQELLAYIEAPEFDRGARTKYTDTSFLLLGQIAEHVTGKRIVELYHQRLWGPLELVEIFLAGHEPAPGSVAHALGADGFVDPLEHMSVLSSGNSGFGVMSNARTIARWGHALFTGSVLTARMQQAMREMVPAAGNIPGESGAGLGIRGYDYLDRRQIGHSGGGAYARSLMIHEPDSGVTVAVVMNQSGHADHFTLAPRLLEIATRP